jgi:Na+/proline symporter
VFGFWDWAIVVAYIVGTTVVGHHLKGKQHTTRDFFLGGRNLPWYAVSASTIATTISAVTFVGVPAIVYADGGNFVYLQLALGGIIARILVARFLVPLYYEKEFYSPYDYMTDRLGPVVGRITAGMFFLDDRPTRTGRWPHHGRHVFPGWHPGTRRQGVCNRTRARIDHGLEHGGECCGHRDICRPLDLDGRHCCRHLDRLCAVFHSRGRWNRSTLFCIRRIAGSMVITGRSGTGCGQVRVAFTFWAALIAMPFQNVAVYGTDHLFVQRLLCCRSKREAQKAVLWSTAGELVPILMLTVGVGLFAFYEHFPLSSELAALVDERGDRIFPVFIISEIPSGLKGLLIAGTLSAAISSLDSILAALSQISLTMFYKPFLNPTADERHLLKVSRLLVIFWGGVLAFMAWLFSATELPTPGGRCSDCSCLA